MKWKRRTNNLAGLTIEGMWEERPNIIKKEVKTFFEKHFEEMDCPSLNLDSFPFRTISEVDKVGLTARFDPLEIKEVVWDCDGDKSPGPDGLNFQFIKFFWHILKAMFRESLRTSTLIVLGLLEATHLSLL